MKTELHWQGFLGSRKTSRTAEGLENSFPFPPSSLSFQALEEAPRALTHQFPSLVGTCSSSC